MRAATGEAEAAEPLEPQTPVRHLLSAYLRAAAVVRAQRVASHLVALNAKPFPVRALERDLRAQAVGEHHALRQPHLLVQSVDGRLGRVVKSIFGNLNGILDQLLG